MSGDVHSPTNAGPDLGPASEPAPAAPAAPAASPSDSGDPAVLVGAAFAGGLVAAFILKRIRGRN